MYKSVVQFVMKAAGLEQMCLRLVWTFVFWESHVVAMIPNLQHQ